MYLVDFPNLAPSMCIVCESCPPETAHVDTRFNLEIGPWPQSGRKYLCVNCVRDAAHVAGVFDEEREKLRDEIGTAMTQVHFLTVKLAEFEALETALETFGKAPARKKKADPSGS